MRKLIIILSVVIAFGAYYYVSKGSSELYTASTVSFADKSQAASVSYSDNGNKALLEIDGESYHLVRARSASGSKYQSEGGSIVFIEHQGSFVVEKNGQTIIDTGQ